MSDIRTEVARDDGIRDFDGAANSVETHLSRLADKLGALQVSRDALEANRAGGGDVTARDVSDADAEISAQKTAIQDYAATLTP